MKIKIKTHLWTGIIMGALSIFLLATLTQQVRLPSYDSGAPSPRIIPGVCIIGILICSAIVIIQSVFFHKDKIYVFEWKKEKPSILLILLMVAFVVITLHFGYIIGVCVMMAVILAACKEKNPLMYVVILAIGVGIYFLFANVFHVYLPSLNG